MKEKLDFAESNDRQIFCNQHIHFEKIYRKYIIYRMLFSPHPLLNFSDETIKKIDACEILEHAKFAMQAEIFTLLKPLFSKPKSSKRKPMFSLRYVFSDETINDLLGKGSSPNTQRVLLIENITTARDKIISHQDQPFLQSVSSKIFTISESYEEFDKFFLDTQKAFTELNEGQGDEKFGLFGNSMSDAVLAKTCQTFIQNATRASATQG